MLGLLLQATQDKRIQSIQNIITETLDISMNTTCRRFRFSVYDVIEKHRRMLGIEGMFAGEHFVQKNSERKHVRRWNHLQPLNLLGGKVIRSPITAFLPGFPGDLP